MNHHHAMTRSAHAVLILLTLAAIVPFVLLIIASFTDNNVAITEGFSFFPSKWSTDAYQYIVNEKDTMLRAYGITIVVTLIGTTLGLLISVMLAYSLANSDLPGRNFMTFFVTLTMLFNGGLVPTDLHQRFSHQGHAGGPDRAQSADEWIQRNPYSQLFCHRRPHRALRSGKNRRGQ